MKKNLIILIVSIACSLFTAKAQDIIIKKTGDEIKCKEIFDDNEITINYIPLNHPNGTKTINKSEVATIKYENGSIMDMAKTETGYKSVLVLKKRMAVLEFKNKVGAQSVSNGKSGMRFRETQDQSASLTDMLTTDLQKSGRYIILERDRINAVLKEQDFQSSESVDHQSAVKIGNLLGVQIIITGSITECSLKEETSESNLPNYKFSNTKMTARVVVDLRIVDAETGEILYAESAVSEKSSTSSSSSMQYMASGTSSADNSILDKAKRDAIQKCVDLIGKYSAKVPWNGHITAVNDDNTIVMTPGSSGGIKPGMKFIVYSKGENLIDKETGESLGFKTTKIGSIEVESDFGDKGKACNAKIISGQGFKQGDIIKLE